MLSKCAKVIHTNLSSRKLFLLTCYYGKSFQRHWEIECACEWAVTCECFGPLEVGWAHGLWERAGDDQAGEQTATRLRRGGDICVGV